MILPWIRAGFECCDGIRILYMEKNLLYESMVSCDVFDSGTGSKKMEPEEWGVGVGGGGGTRCKEGANKAKASEGHQWVNIDWEFINGSDHRVMCVIEKKNTWIKFNFR